MHAESYTGSLTGLCDCIHCCCCCCTATTVASAVMSVTALPAVCPGDCNDLASDAAAAATARSAGRRALKGLKGRERSAGKGETLPLCWHTQTACTHAELVSAISSHDTVSLSVSVLLTTAAATLLLQANPRNRSPLAFAALTARLSSSVVLHMHTGIHTRSRMHALALASCCISFRFTCGDRATCDPISCP